jgi:hypothetical protein
MPREILEYDDVQENIDTGLDTHGDEIDGLERLELMLQNYKDYTKEYITDEINVRYTELLQGRTDFQNEIGYQDSVYGLRILIRLINKILEEDNQFNDSEKKNFATIKDFFQSKVAEFNRVATERGYYLPRTQGGFRKSKKKVRKNTRTKKSRKSRKARKARKSRK